MYYPPKDGQVVYRPRTKHAILAYVRVHGRVWRRRVEDYINVMYGIQRLAAYHAILRLEQRGKLRYTRGILSMGVGKL